MIKIKKLLASITIMAIICSNFSLAAYAATTEDNTQSATQTMEAVTATVTPAVTDSNQTQTALNEVPADNTKADAEVIANNDNKVTTLKDTEVKSDTKKTKTVSSAKKKVSYKKSDLRLLSCLIYTEAGNQAYNTMLGVANVVMNRVGSKAYWHIDSIKEAIYDRKWSVQFAVTIKNKRTGVSPYSRALNTYDSGKYNSSMKKAIKAAKAALSGDNNIGSYMCFSNKNYKSYVKKHYSKYRVIDDMIFYRTK